MNETPVLTEEPVLYPREIKKDAFFYFHENEGLFYRHRRHARIANPILRTHYMLDIPSLLLYPLLGIGILYGLAHFLQMPLGAAFLITMFCTPFTFALLTSWVIDATGTYKNRRINNRFYSEGTIVEGTLTSIVGSHPNSRDARYYVEAEYTYMNPAGETRHATIKSERPDLKGLPLPSTGVPVYVLYFDDRENYLL